MGVYRVILSFGIKGKDTSFYLFLWEGYFLWVWLVSF